MWALVHKDGVVKPTSITRAVIGDCDDLGRNEVIKSGRSMGHIHDLLGDTFDTEMEAVQEQSRRMREMVYGR